MPKEATERYYNKHAKWWTKTKTDAFHHETQFRKFVDLLPKKGAVLDIGCAAGQHVPLFLGIGRHLTYHGMDISDAFLTIARSRYPQLKFTKGDVSDRTSLPRKKFDGFMASAVLMHVPIEKWPDMLTAIESRMQPGAIGYITLPVAHPSGKERAKQDPRHFTLLDMRAQKKWFADRGWTIREYGKLDGFTQKGVWRWYLVQLP